MAKPAKAQSYKHAANISWRKVGPEGVLLNLDTSAYYSLNEIGVLVWERLGMGDDAASVTDAVCRVYDREPELVRKDVETLIKDLLAKGLLQPA